MKTSKKLSMGIGVLLCATMLFSTIQSGSAITPPTQTSYTMADDGYHYVSDKLAPKVVSGLYTENWYFEFRSDELTFYMSFEVNNPAETPGAPLAAVAYSYCSIIIDNEIVVDESGRTTPYALSEFSASPDKLDVKVANNYAKALSMDIIVTAGTDRDAGISWDLVFDRADGAPQTYIHNTQMGIYQTDLMNWFSMMPSARVTGVVTWNGMTWNVDCDEGYHDHNWGDTKTFTLNPWSKFFAKDGQTSLLVSGIIVPNPMTYKVVSDFFFVYINGQSEKMKMTTMEYLDFAVDPVTGMMYLSTFHVVLENERYLIDYVADDGDNPFFGTVEPYAGYMLFFQNALSYRADGMLYTRQGNNVKSLVPLMDFSVYSTVEQLIIQ